MRGIQFLEPGKDAAEMLELIDETFHQIALAIPPFTVGSFLFGARVRRNHDFYTLFMQAVHERLSRISPISDNPLKVEAFNQFCRLRAVMSLPRAQAETQGLARSIDRQMHFTAKSAATASQGLRLSFFGRRRHRGARTLSYCQ